MRILQLWFLLSLGGLLVCCAACQRSPSAPAPEAARAPEPVVAPPQAAAPAPEAGVEPAVEGLTAGLPRPEGFFRGVSLGLFVSEEDPGARRFYYEQLLDEIRDVGATDVSLVVRWAQRDIHATDIAPLDGVTPPDVVLLEVVGLARARGLRVFLMPILHLERRRRGHWRGRLRPQSWEPWWASYRAFLLHYARLAQSSGVELLAVGSELVSTESQQARWRALIKEVRQVYRGDLTYSANWDHFEPVQFWDALDVVGVTAYQELSKEPDPSEEALVRGWRPFRARLRRWAAQHNHKYLFTEVGFPSHSQGAARPWDYTPRGRPDSQLQLRAWRSTYKVWSRDPNLRGFFAWNWFGVGGPQDRSYTPRGKPSEHLLRHWFTQKGELEAGPHQD